MSTSKEINQCVDKLLKKMTMDEKVSLLAGRDIWNTVPIERLGIPSITMTDGPHGVRSTAPEAGRKMGAVTAFPTGIAMGASWNPELVEEVGQALGEETRGMDCDILLGPCVNIVRDPRGGRNFETFSEDPYLTGRMAVAYINGVQSRGVGTSLKHFAANNYEEERHRASSKVDERTLREIYLVQFEMAVKEAQPWTVMCSYNRVNGVYASQHQHLLNEILKEEWGFKGAVVSDWAANHTIFESVQGGLDLEMPGPARYYKLLGDAVHTWQIDEEVVDEAVRRVPDGQAALEGLGQHTGAPENGAQIGRGVHHATQERRQPATAGQRRQVDCSDRTECCRGGHRRRGKFQGPAVVPGQPAGSAAEKAGRQDQDRIHSWQRQCG